MSRNILNHPVEEEIVFEPQEDTQSCGVDYFGGRGLLDNIWIFN